LGRKGHKQHRILPSEREQVITLRKGGAPLQGIHEETKISFSTVRWILAKAGVRATTQTRAHNNRDNYARQNARKLAAYGVATWDDVMQLFASDNGGRHVGKFVSSRTNTTFICPAGHEFTAKPHNIQQGQWCRACVIDARRLSIEDLQELALKRGGRLLSTHANGADTKHTWRCAQGHEFKQTPTDIKGGHWCSKCARNRPLTVEDLRALARQKGWELLSQTSAGCQKDHLWECPKGHVVKKQPNNLRFSECRQCAAGRHASKGQLFVLRAAREALPGREVICSELDAITPYELDVFIPSLRKAIEFDGVYFHALPKQRKRDLAKDRLCREREIELLRIPETVYLHDREEVRRRVQRFLTT
jgi:hypothetical protein